MTMDYLLYKIRKNQVMEMLYPRTLKKLMNYDQSKGTDLTGLLSIYLDCERSITKTSEKAYLHRNTVMYQINKITEIIGTDLEDSDERLVFQLALKQRERNIPDVNEISLSDLSGMPGRVVFQDSIPEPETTIDWF